MPPSQGALPSDVALGGVPQQQATTPCFSCRQPILSGMLGCPSCGARNKDEVDLTVLEDKEVDFKKLEKGKNEFTG
mgnify:CR=1 FL=1